MKDNEEQQTNCIQRIIKSGHSKKEQVMSWSRLLCVILAVFAVEGCRHTSNVSQTEQLSHEDLIQRAIPKGIEDANIDFSNGVYRIEAYGLFSRSRNPVAIYLEKQYQVFTVSVAECIVVEKVRGHAEGYNTRMKELLLKRYGKDIFQEAEDLWKKGKLKRD